MSHCCRMIQNSIRFPWVQLTLNNYLSISNIWVKWLALISLGALLGGVQGANHRNGSMQHTTADRTVNSASGVASEIMSIHGSVDAETSNLSEEDEPDQFVRNCIIVSQNGRQEYIPKSNVSNLSRQISAFSADQQTGQRTTRSGGNSNPMVTIYNNGNEVIGYPSSSHSMSEEFPSNGERGTSRSLSGSISSSVPGQTLLAMSSSSIIEDYADVMISRPSPNMPELHRQCSGSLPRGNSCAFDCSPQQRMVKLTFPFDINNIEDILSSSSYYLIDKSNWVPIWITHTAQVAIFLRPRLFGKSIALSYAHAYLDHSRKSTGHTLHTQMFHAVDLRRDHFHKHSIVALRFGHKSIMATSTPLELELAVMQYLGSVISIIMKSYRKTAKDLIDDFQSYYQLLCGKYPSTNLEEWVDSLSLMIDMLQHFSKVTVAVLVDDYDKVLKKASELQVHDRIANFFSNFYRNGLNKAIKHKKLFKAAIFGTQRFHDKIPFKDVDSHRFFSLGDEPFSREFGFTLIEVAKAIRAFSSDLQVEDLNAVYGGYPTANQAEPLLHPYGIAKALSNGNISQDYWTRRVYIEFDSPPFSNLVGMGVGDLYRLLGTPGDKNISGYTPCHMNLSSLSQSSSCNEVLTYLRHAGLITFQHGNSELRAINRPAVNFLAKNLQNWFSRLTGINNSWLVLASKNWASFEAHLSRAWKTPTVFGNRAPFTLEKRSAFRELFERSANNYGDFLLPLSIEIEDVKIAGKVFRFKSSDQSVVILLVFGFVYDSLKEGQVPSRIAASLIQGLKPKLMNTIPAPNHLMAVIFYAGRPDLGIYIDVV